MIRLRRDADLSSCVEVLARVHEHDLYPFNWPSDPAGWIAFTSREIKGWVAVERVVGIERVVGHVGLHTATGDPALELWCNETRRTPEGLAVVARFFVDPSRRGLGLGEQLLKAATAAAHKSELYPVLDVARKDESAIELYERLGWEQVGADTVETPTDAALEVFMYKGPPPPTLRSSCER